MRCSTGGCRAFAVFDSPADYYTRHWIAWWTRGLSEKDAKKERRWCIASGGSHCVRSRRSRRRVK